MFDRSKWQAERNHKHGHAHRGKVSLTYKRWLDMAYRVYHDPDYTEVHIDLRWQSFANFLEDMGECPPGLTLDRIENNKGYAPGNCRWATQKQQANNKTTNRLLEYKGKTQTLAQWSEELKMPYKTLFSRINQYKMDVETAFTKPVKGTK